MEREKLRLDKREQSIYAHKAWGLHCNVKYVLQYVPLIPKGWIQNPFFFGGAVQMFGKSLTGAIRCEKECLWKCA